MTAITFLTDYGLEDGFVAACHGVLARVAPGARVLDITHLVPAGDIRRGAVVLAQTVPYLPPAVHVAVVDPGVGTPRRGIAVQAGAHVFVGPDNGVLAWAADALGGPELACEITRRDLMLHPVSPTFHGRDVFAPVAAHLAGGLRLREVGPPLALDTLVRLPAPVSRVENRVGYGEVLTIDRFGNVQTSLAADALTGVGVALWDTLTLEAGGRSHAARYHTTFGEAAPGELLVYLDSAGLVSLAVNGASAAARLGLGPGVRLSIRSR
ncbi:MAG: SAM hydrolase/SAM-dependent halogenase family protein [Carbonactinosporaceae bacterium]